MKKFENWATRINEKYGLGEGVLDHFKSMSSKGWELVAVIYGAVPDTHEFYWKREVIEPIDNPLASASVPDLPCEPITNKQQ